MMGKLVSSLCLFLIVSVYLISCAPREIKKVEVLPSERVVMIDNSTFAKEVEGYDGFALVLFHNEKFWQSKDMEKRFGLFADKFYGKAKFCKFHWDINADTKPYSLEMLPTVALYKSGTEIDRIKGIPPDKKERLKWNDDIELWFLKNVLGLEGSKYSGKYKFMFNNTNELHISNY